MKKNNHNIRHIFVSLNLYIVEIENNTPKKGGNYKMASFLVRETGGARRVHVKNCPIVNNYGGNGVEEVPRFKYGKYNTCNMCKSMMYVASMADDYEENFKKYKKWLSGTKPDILGKIAFNKHGRLKIVNDRLYIKVGTERFYIDMKLFELGEVSLWHNNYNLKKRADGSEIGNWEESGYHEHKLEYRVKDVVGNALEYVFYYEYDKAKEVHDKARKQRIKPTYTENDPAYWGMDD